MKTAVLVTPMAADFPMIDNADYIGVDAGILHILKAGLHPVLAVGDFDSMEPGALEQIEGDVAIKKAEVMKDETDSELALLIAKEKGYERIVMAGAFGGRIDHTIANLRLLEFRDRSLVLWEKDQVVFCLEQGVHVLESGYRNVSFFALEPTVLSLDGFLYPLDQRRIGPKDIYTISNRITEKRGTVTIKSGCVLCVLTNE